MQATAAMFRSRIEAESAIGALQADGFGLPVLTLLTPGAQEETLREVPRTEAEGPGMGAAIGGVVGGAAGAAGGLTLATAATLLVPGAGPVLVLGAVAAGLLGLGGVVSGTRVGQALDDASATGIPADEIEGARTALAAGRSVVLVSAPDGNRLDLAQAILSRHGGEVLAA